MHYPAEFGRGREIPEDHENIFSAAGDARDLRAYKDKSFDLVFSNSCIEHVGSFDDQKKMADEMLRVGRHCYLQTPNRYFFMEPHFLFPFFQFFPLKLKCFLLRHFSMGHYQKARTKDKALEVAKSVRLMTEKELQGLFGGVEIRRERLWHMTKSFYLYF